ncbi:hypothetical protein E3P92_01459 [Wallemia ichthyophaga]|nr:hypothetical protein E3P91_01146 [Wallemia ichthyophaga]TIA82595.1 hypothetical protein E3P98_01286 [Wallemia ichthyophaga]TIB05933.1 hypothetical protein E3P96_00752 [Wallemia ichthyophaga]TIB16083.1 hypothetical protein E3P92_01459 [Wallemia ichthyophaga]TIB66867.1 hypothetical protein E3P77_01986 [Wallemia ichthyophaga]
MATMKSVVIDTPNDVANSSSDLKIQVTPQPTLSATQVLVKVVAFGVNRMDLLQAKGMYPLPPQAPKTLGVEFSGVVVDANQSAEWKIDDEVFGLAYGGAYAEYIAVDAHMILRKPTHLTHVQCAAICENYLTAHQALSTIGRIKAGDDVLIHAGASGVGMAAIQLARHYGARRVFATAGSDAKIDAVKGLPMGATHGINYRTQSFDKEVLAHTDNKGVDVIVDMVGQSYLNANINAAGKDARIVLLGVMSGMVASEVNVGPIIFKRLCIQGSTLRSRSAEYQGDLLNDFRKAALDKVGKDLELRIHSVFSWKQIALAHDCMAANENTGKIVVTVD